MSFFFLTRRRFVARFEAIRGFSPRGDIAIDDFSLTPECFGLGM